MKTEIHYLKPSPKPLTIEEFADNHDLVMVICERQHPVNDNFRFYAHFKDAETKDRSILSSEYGDGPTPQKAVEDYTRLISGKLLIINAYSADRLEINVPQLKV